MRIYLADLAHNYLPGLNMIPLNVAYVAAYAKAQFGNDVDIQIFKYADDLLQAIEKEQPDLLGMSNYSWNYRLNAFVGARFRKKYPNTPVVMGGPNIRSDNPGIASFLKSNDYVDMYCMYEGEVPFSRIVQALLLKPAPERTSAYLRSIELDGCFSLHDGTLKGRNGSSEAKDLDYIPSPYTAGLLDKFINKSLIPLFETNRGCPYTCSFCAWGVSARKRMKAFSLERVKSEMQYVADKGVSSPVWTLADANFGMYKRDVEIAHLLREIYDNQKAFGQAQIWWDKNAAAHIIEIAEILGPLSKAYIAHQTFDHKVSELILRRNISIDKLQSMSEALGKRSGVFHTDILVGLPGETYESHLNSLNTAFHHGFDSIGGGEVRLLMGSELETDASRQKHGLKTRYRLIQEGFGVYDGEFVFELEESVRGTNWIEEKDMFRLRILRALFYGSITIGEFLPLMKYLKSQGVTKITDFFQKFLETADADPLVAESIEWLNEKAHNEWFDTIEEAEAFYSKEAIYSELLTNPAIKLNHDFLSNLILSPKHYRAFYQHVAKTILANYPECDPAIVRELLVLCEQRNFVSRFLNGDTATETFVKLSPEALNLLIKIGYLTGDEIEQDGIRLSINETLANVVRDRLSAKRASIQEITLISHMAGTFHMEPLNRKTEDAVVRAGEMARDRDSTVCKQSM